MAANTIDHGMLTRLVQAGGISGAHVVGRDGGWTVVVTYGNRESPLVAQRSQEVRVWRRFETLAAYLRDIGIVKFDVDATRFDPAAPAENRRPDRADALRRAHEAAAHDTWFRTEVAAAVAEADAPATSWLADDDVAGEGARHRDRWRRKAGGEDA